MPAAAEDVRAVDVALERVTQAVHDHDGGARVRSPARPGPETEAFRDHRAREVARAAVGKGPAARRGAGPARRRAERRRARRRRRRRAGRARDGETRAASERWHNPRTPSIAEEVARDGAGHRPQSPWRRAHPRPARHPARAQDPRRQPGPRRSGCPACGRSPAASRSITTPCPRPTRTSKRRATSSCSAARACSSATRGSSALPEAKGLDEMIRLALHAAFRKGFSGSDIRSAVERWLAAVASRPRGRGGSLAGDGGAAGARAQAAPRHPGLLLHRRGRRARSRAGGGRADPGAAVPRGGGARASRRGPRSKS